MEEAIEAVSDADIFVIVGTSLNVYPAAGLINFVPQSAKIYLIDPFNVETPRGYAVEVIQEVASKGMGILEQILLKKS
jgi:NAD-dependent deacetylase